MNNKISSIIEGIHDNRLYESKIYYVIKKDYKTGKEELIEIMKASNEKEARRNATSKYIDIVTSGTYNLIVVGKAGYDQYHRGVLEAKKVIRCPKCGSTDVEEWEKGVYYCNECDYEFEDKDLK